jgi:hypothetical protein
MPIDPTAVIGHWKAARDDGTSFDLTLSDDKKFNWSFTPKGQAPKSFSGTYAIEGANLALERTGGGSILAQVTAQDGQHFNFKPVGAPSEDPGLTFHR